MNKEKTETEGRNSKRRCKKKGKKGGERGRETGRKVTNGFGKVVGAEYLRSTAGNGDGRVGKDGIFV